MLRKCQILVQNDLRNCLTYSRVGGQFCKSLWTNRWRLQSVSIAVFGIIVTWIFYSLLLFSSCSLNSHDIPLSQRSICLITRGEFRGEREFAERIRIACENLRWGVEIADIALPPLSSRSYDWVLTLVPGRSFKSSNNDYLVLFDPVHHYFNQDGRLNGDFHYYAGYLATYKNTNLLLADIEYQPKRLYPKEWYPTVQYRPYQKVTPTRLFYFIGHWGNRRDDMKYQLLQKELAQKKYTNVFGNPAQGIVYGDAFQGAIDYDGESVINCITEMGVCLVLHSETHLQHKIPSGRIFEAAAASAVIISDLNPFVIEHFGDSVLYVDQELSGVQMAEQIDVHMVWIQNHPEEALMMSQRAHQIFEERFLLENQLLDFDHYHRTKHH